MRPHASWRESSCERREETGERPRRSSLGRLGCVCQGPRAQEMKKELRGTCGKAGPGWVLLVVRLRKLTFAKAFFKLFSRRAFHDGGVISGIRVTSFTVEVGLWSRRGPR